MLAMFYKFIYIHIYIYILWKYIKMIEITDLTYYQKNRTVILNKAKDYYKNNKERLTEQAREEEKHKKREYGKNRYHNMSEEKKQRLKEYQKEYQKIVRKKKLLSIMHKTKKL